MPLNLNVIKIINLIKNKRHLLLIVTWLPTLCSSVSKQKQSVISIILCRPYTSLDFHHGNGLNEATMALAAFWCTQWHQNGLVASSRKTGGEGWLCTNKGWHIHWACMFSASFSQGPGLCLTSYGQWSVTQFSMCVFCCDTASTWFFQISLNSEMSHVFSEPCSHLFFLRVHFPTEES